MKTALLSKLNIVIYTLAVPYSMIAGTTNLLCGWISGRYQRSDLVHVPWLRWVARNNQ